MYEKDKTYRITLRLNERQFAFVKKNAETMDVSPSDFLRIVINTSMVMFDTQEAQKNSAEIEQKVIQNYVANNPQKVAEATEFITEIKEGDGRENDKADKHHFV